VRQRLHPAPGDHVEALFLVIGDDPLDRLADQRHPVQPLGREDRLRVDLVRLAEFERLADRRAQMLDQRILVEDRHVDLARRPRRWLAVDRERPLQAAQHPRIIHDQAVVLVPRHSVRARDGLHQRVIAHRLVEIDRRAGRHVEAGDPHGAQEHDPKRVVLVLELGF
jgi:hypothetical protein